MIPSFDGADLRQYERRVRPFVSTTRVAPERRAGKLLERLQGHAFDLCQGIHDRETPKGVENLLDHLRMYFEPIDVFRQGGVVDDFVGDFERQPGEEVEEYPPRGDAMPTAVPQARALRGDAPLRREQSGAYPAQVVEAPDEEDEEVHVLVATEASDDEWEAEYQEAVAMMTVAGQRRAEVNRARRFFREPRSFEGRKTQLDKLKQKLPCARCGQLGHWKDDNDCPAKVKAVDSRKPKSFQFPPSGATCLSREREQCSTTSSLSSAHGAEARALDEGVYVTPETVEGAKKECSSKFVGELGTVSCVSGDSNPVDLPQIFLCESDESLLHIFGLRISRAAGYVLGVRDTEQTFSCQPDGVVSGTQPVCEPLPCSAPQIDSEHGVDVCIDSVDERSCVVSCASSYSIVGDPGCLDRSDEPFLD